MENDPCSLAALGDTECKTCGKKMVLHGPGKIGSLVLRCASCERGEVESDRAIAAENAAERAKKAAELAMDKP